MDSDSDRITICSLPGEVKLSVLLHLDAESIFSCKLVSHSDQRVGIEPMSISIGASMFYLLHYPVSAADPLIYCPRHVVAYANSYETIERYNTILR